MAAIFPIKRVANFFRDHFSEYGMVLVLLVIVLYFSWATWEIQYPRGESAGRALATALLDRHQPGERIMIFARGHDEDRLFSRVLAEAVQAGGLEIAAHVNGNPPDVRRALEKAQQDGRPIHAITGNHVTLGWAVLKNLATKYPVMAKAERHQPQPYYWPNFLKKDNLLNIANQISVVAIIAIGMTMVIITAGIDLSVGSLIAFSAVVCTLLIRDYGGALDAPWWVMILCSLAAILACGLLGTFSGVMITQFAVPPFIATLSMMMMASGMAYLLADGQSNNDIPESFNWLGRGDDFLGIPNTVVLMALLYILAHVVMTRTRIGRYIYATGGNPVAARLSGVPVKTVILFVYTCCGCLAGLGGVILSSELESGSPTFGHLYELTVIAAVVVGGTSLAGGEGRIMGTLVGAFIIGVIENGMNLLHVESFTRKVVLGLAILGAVLLDRIKKRGWRAFRAS